MKNMHGMFAGAKTLNGPIANWNASSVIDMSDIFRDASSFNGYLYLQDVYSNMLRMFYKAKK